jgi:MshEN domain/Type II/IV secretion system protein
VPSPTRVTGRTVTALLTDAGVVTEDQVQAGLAYQRETGRRIGEALVELGYVTEEDIGWALARQLGIPLVDVRVDALDRELVREFPEGLLHRLEVVPLMRAEHSLSVAVSDPTDDSIIDEIERAARCTVQVSVATRGAIRAALTNILGSPSENATAIAVSSTSAHQFDVVWDRSGASFLLFYLSGALAAGATEIQFWPRPGELHIRHRVGGRLISVASEPPEVTYSLLARLSALGGPAIDDRDHHVRGQVVCPHGQQKVLLDVSLLDHDHGIAVTLGVRSLPERPPALEDLGFDPLDLARIREALDPTNGLVIVTGPVRTGCSTTLGCLASVIETDDRRAIAFETRPGPPMPTDTRVPLTAAEARASWAEIVTAQNADIAVLSDVLIGESVSEALTSAGSGRLVLASTDWTDTLSLIEYLMARPNLRPALASRLRFVVQQRLAHLEAAGEKAPGVPRRRAIFEVFHVSEPMRRLLRNGDPSRELRAMAEADGWRPLATRVKAMLEAGEIGAREAARLVA